MTKTTWAGTCGAIVAAATVAVMAQQTAPPPQTQTAPPPQTSSASSPDQITVTGCLKAAPPAAADPAATGTAGATGTTGTVGAAAATDANARFVLTDATVGPAAPPASETSAAGSAAGAAAGSQASANAAQTYRLVANPASLSPHVGKKLELTGTIVKSSPGSASAEPPASPSNAPELRVEKGKVIAASCDQK